MHLSEENAPDKILRFRPGCLLIHRKFDQIIHTHSGKKPPLLLTRRKLAHLFSAFAEEDRRGRVKGKNRGPSPLFPLSEDHLQNFLMAQMHSVKLADGSRRLLRDLKLCGAADNLHIFSPLRQNPRMRFCRMRQPVRQHRCCCLKAAYRRRFQACSPCRAFAAAAGEIPEWAFSRIGTLVPSAPMSLTETSSLPYTGLSPGSICKDRRTLPENHKP